MKQNLALLFPGRIDDEKRHLSVQIAVQEKDNLQAIWIKGGIKPQKPYFGAQPYLDAAKGIRFFGKLTGAEKILTIYQHKEWWLRPEFPKLYEQIPPRTQLLVAKGQEEYLAVLAVCGREYRTDIAGCEGGLEITMASNCANKNEIDDLSLICARGADPYACCHEAVKYALSLTGRSEMLRENRVYPRMFEKLGWCSWDAFYHKVSQQGIFDKLEELQEKKVPVSWALIDDGWLDADYESQKLKGLDAAADKFPDGLKGCAEQMKARYGLSQVGVWHAVMGYWNGLEEGSPAAKRLEQGSCCLPDSRTIVAADEGKAFQFYSTWHEYLKNKCGIDFVKVDGQSAISLFYRGLKEYGRAGAQIQAGLNASAALHFNNQIINCMGMAPEDMWNRPSSAISRSSDDFVPDKENGFWEHAVQNGYNSLLQGQFFWGDWDMFWSSHREKRQNALLRAVSGGPVYTSDPVGKTDPAYIWPLIKKDGTVIRCSSVGMPTMDCLFENPIENGKAFKLFNRYKDCFVVAAFSLGREYKSCSGNIRLSDIPGLAGQNWIVYDQRAQRAAFFSDEIAFTFELDHNDAALFLLLPAKRFVPIGILEKLIGPGCIGSVKEIEKRMVIRVSEAGMVGFVSDREPVGVLVDGNKVPFICERCAGDEAGGFFCRTEICEMGQEEYLLEVLYAR